MRDSSDRFSSSSADRFFSSSSSDRFLFSSYASTDATNASNAAFNAARSASVAATRGDGHDVEVAFGGVAFGWGRVGGGR